MTQTPLADRIAALEAARYQAMIAGDIEALSRLLSDRLTYTHSTALTETKTEYLASVAKGVFRYRDIKVSDPGDPRSRRRCAPKLLQSRFLNVWVQEGGDWRMIAWQSTPVPAGAH